MGDILFVILFAGLIILVIYLLFLPASIAKDIQDFLLGHAASSVGESYGQGYSLKSKKEAIDRLNLSFLASTD